MNTYIEIAIIIVSVALIASMVHYGTHTIREIKSYLHEKGIKVRMTW